MTTLQVLLSAEELSAVTGYQKPALQVRELHRRGFARARVNARNEVVLERAHFEAVCRGVESANDASAGRPQVQPPLSRRSR